jgi:hypothetical protein
MPVSDHVVWSLVTWDVLVSKQPDVIKTRSDPEFGIAWRVVPVNRLH